MVNSYRVDISTARNPTPSACTPRFATEREANRYAHFLATRHPFIFGASVHEDGAEPNATFRLNRIRWLPAAEPLEGVDAT